MGPGLPLSATAVPKAGIDPEVAVTTVLLANITLRLTVTVVAPVRPAVPAAIPAPGLQVVPLVPQGNTSPTALVAVPVLLVVLESTVPPMVAPNVRPAFLEVLRRLKGQQYALNASLANISLHLVKPHAPPAQRVAPLSLDPSRVLSVQQAKPRISPR